MAAAFFCQINLYLRFAEIRTCCKAVSFWSGIKPINVSPIQKILFIWLRHLSKYLSTSSK